MLSSQKAWRPLPCSVFALVLLAAAGAWGQAGIDINSSPSLVGSGARALGMGGAFIAIADDATAASWNPGGLTQLERPEISAVYSMNWFSERFSDTHFLRTDDDFCVDPRNLNYLSVVYPIPWTLAGRNLVVSLNYQHKLDFSREFDFRARQADMIPIPGAALYRFSTYDVSFNQDGSLATLSPALGFEITNNLSLGIAWNIWDSDIVPGNEWSSTTKRRYNMMFAGLGTFPGQMDTYEDFENFQGHNYTLGLLWKATRRLQLGAVYHSGFRARVDYTSLTIGHSPFLLARRTSNLAIEFPKGYGIGAAYRFPGDKLTLSLDITRRDWNDYVQIDPRGGLATRRTSPITGLPKWQSYHSPTYAVRLGGEYVFVNYKKAKQDYLPSARAGFFYDPQPASNRKAHWWGIDNGDGSPDDYFGFSLGGGVLIHDRVNIDAVYQFRWGNNVRRDTVAGAPAWLERGFRENVRQHTIYLSTVVYF